MPTSASIYLFLRVALLYRAVKKTRFLSRKLTWSVRLRPV